MPAGGVTYVVTGGCGFLGSHIVDLLVERGTDISEIRVVDMKLRGYTKAPGKSGVKVKLIRGDVTNMAEMTEVCAGADVVIHTASLIDVFGLVSDATLYRDPTAVLCERRCDRNTIGPNRRGDPVDDGNESTPYDSSSLPLYYHVTKRAAEMAVLRWNGRSTNGGKTLHTCALRPGALSTYEKECGKVKHTALPADQPPAVVPCTTDKLTTSVGHVTLKKLECAVTTSCIYGDGEMMTLKIWREMGVDPFAGPLQRISHPDVIGCCAYVGNYAWAHLLAAKTLLTSPSNAGGEAFCITDDTPVQNELSTYNDICAPIGIRWHDSLLLPLWVLYLIAYLLALLRFLLKPVYDFVPRLTPGVLTLVNTNFYFNYKKATRLLGYKPLFTWEESKRRTQEGLMAWKAREFSQTSGAAAFVSKSG
ncbi:3 beta-hydroxysteroid dehydrogenase type 7 [Branchiostoma belcheri]|nr:3 beta-hydroxysteroid dehydrogenase type 7 [Branchiostoma belcheri]